MTSLSINRTASSSAYGRVRDASGLLWWTALAFLAAFVVCALLSVIDPRQLNGISTWAKPAKFFLSLAIHMLTLGFGLALLPRPIRQGWTGRTVTLTMATMAILEMAYIAGRAARAEASHFNTGSAFAELAYSLMGAGAAAMMLVTILLGVQVLRHGRPGTLTLATGWAFILSGVLTLLVGFTLGGMGSHWIGGDQTDATGLPLLGWSTTGGDLRTAHFAATHLTQVLPLAAFAGSRRIVVLAAAAGVAVTLALYLQALAGRPLIAL